MTKPKTVKQWEKVCSVLDSALKNSIKDEEALEEEINHLYGEIDKLEEQLIMSRGVIKYLETKIV